MINNALRAIQGSDRQNKIFWVTKKWLPNDWQPESQIVQTVQQATGAYGGVYIVTDRMFPGVSGTEIHDALAALCDRGFVEWYGAEGTEVFWRLVD